MKSRYRQLWFVLGACFLLLVAISLAANGFPVLGEAQIAHRPQKNPKLSTPLALLSMNVKQETSRPAVAEAVTPPAGFSKEALPKPLQDAIHAGQMRITDKGEVQVYIEVDAVTSQNLDELRSYGVTVQIIGEPKPDKSKGEVLTKVPTVQGLLPVTMINQVSALSFLRYIRLPDYGFKSTGSVDSQGDQILQAAQARTQFGIDGTGVRVGVISDGIGGVFATGCTTCGPTTATPSPINTGDLPTATGTRNSTGILTSVSGGITAQSFRADGNLEACLGGTCDTSGNVGAEGTAMLEIVHDLAPGAKLYFANFDTSLSFEQAVDFLAPNTDVAVDDIGFPGNPPYDGTDSVSTNTATDLNTDTNPIRGYFTAVDNFAQDHYQGLYVDSGTDGTTITGQAGDLHVFQSASGVTVDNQNFGPSIADVATVPASGKIIVFLTWNDPASASSNDYDLFLVPLSCSGFSSANQLPLPPCTISGAPLTSSKNPQTGTQPPTEALAYVNSGASRVAVGIVIQNFNNAATARTFDMFIVGTLGDGANPDHNFNTVSGSVPAEGDAGGSPVSVVSVGAIDQTQCTASGNCVGSVEPYSSQGPTEATPQAAARMKPDVIATDDVTVTGAGGFGMNGPNGSSTGGCAIGETPCYFAGSSAAAPHVAAIAALSLQAAPCLLSSSSVNKPATSRANLRNFITSTAVPLPGISQAVPNNIEGFGLVDALAAIKATLPTVNAGQNQTINATSASGASVTVNGSATDPDSCPVTLSWAGSCGTASTASASLTCPAGNDAETLTASNGGVTASPSTSTVQITVSDFTNTPSPASATISPGQAASYTVTIGSKFGAFTNVVSLACSGLPSLSSCGFSPASVTPGSSSVTSTLTISTTAPSLVFPLVERRIPNTPLFVLWLGLILALTVMVVLARKLGRKRGFAVASCALLVCLVVPIISCSSGGPHNPGTSAGTYTVTIAGTSNQLQHSTTVTLVVQ